MTQAFLFPGQGSQSVGMGQTLYSEYEEARRVYEEADTLLGFSLSQLCFEGPEEILTDTVNQQPALFTTSLAAFAVMQAQGWEMPAFCVGHSLGELSALVAAGSMSFANGLKLVRQRGELMKAAGEATPGAMAAIIALKADQVETICREAEGAVGKPVQVANDNCPGQIVISGDIAALEKAMSLAQEAGARKVVQLPITIAAHSPLMKSAAADFSNAVNSTLINAPTIPVIANVSAQPITTPDAIRHELTAQLTGPVRWTESINYLIGQGVDTFVEVGPGDVLLSLVKRISRRTQRVQFQG